MSITAARLQAEVGADLTGFNKGMSQADARVKGSGTFWSHTLSTAVGVGLERATTAVLRTGVRGLFGAINAGVDSLKQTGVVVAQTNAAIASTAGAANVSADAIRNLSQATEDKTAIDDKQVQAGANLLLTFTNIRNELGAGNDIFNQSVAVLADMSTAMGTDMTSGAIQLGKALNDPLKGITALTRVGVTFSAQQQKQIADFEKAGKTAEAQKVILAELRKEFGGSGAAFAATDAGQAARFQDALEGINQSVAKGLLPTITRVRGQLDKFLRDPATLGQAQALGDAISGIFTDSNLKTAAGLMTTAAHAISEAVHLFAGLPPQVQALAVGAIALKKITGIGPLDIVKGASGLINIVFERGASPANPLFVADVAGGVPGVPGGGAGNLLRTGARVIIPVAIAEVTARAASDLIDPSLSRAIDEGRGLGNRDPRRFGPNGQVVTNELPRALDNTSAALRTADRHLGDGFDNTAAALRTADRHIGELEAAVTANTAAAVRLTAAQQKSIYDASAAARGITHLTGQSTSITPRLKFIASHDDAKGLAVGLALVTHFEQSNRPLYNSTKNQERAIRTLTSQQARFHARGDTHNAAIVGGYITRLKAEMARDQAAAAAKIKAAQDAAAAKISTTVKNKDLSVTITPAPVVLKLDGQKIASVLLKFAADHAWRDRFI